ncbi:hypothetical protein [Botrimarina sp.]|uniref:hypothetical protein n=1 Tax=Botrimarina sp. TaxID=2795802 RepID=UPI0032EE1A37
MRIINCEGCGSPVEVTRTTVRPPIGGLDQSIGLHYRCQSCGESVHEIDWASNLHIDEPDLIVAYPVELVRHV